jgi:hypothetical protein
MEGQRTLHNYFQNQNYETHCLVVDTVELILAALLNIFVYIVKPM